MNYSLLRAISTAACASVVALGCSTITPTGTPPATLAPDATVAQVYVYKQTPSGYAKFMELGGLGGVAIYVDDHRACTLSEDTYARIIVAPGGHEIKGKVTAFGIPGPTVGTITLELASGDTRYIHVESHREPGLGLYVIMPYVYQTMNSVDAEAGASAIAQLREISCNVN